MIHYVEDFVQVPVQDADQGPARASRLKYGYCVIDDCQSSAAHGGRVLISALLYTRP